MDHKRGYSAWIDKRNLKNNIKFSELSFLVELVKSKYGILQRYYHFKRKIAGLTTLYDYDRALPIKFQKAHAEAELPDYNRALPIKFQKAHAEAELPDLIYESFGKISPHLAEIVPVFFAKKWLHTAVYNGKINDAFSHPSTKHPYILLNYHGGLDDLIRLAHELGHGVHQYLAREQGILNLGPSPIIGEIPALFSELLLYSTLLEKSDSAEERLYLLTNLIESIFNNVYRQISIFEFEDKVQRKVLKTPENFFTSNIFNDL